MTNQLTKPTNAQIQQVAKKLEIGWMGILFGDATEKPGNIAGLAIILAFGGLLAVAFAMPGGDETHKGELLTLLGGIVTGDVGICTWSLYFFLDAIVAERRVGFLRTRSLVSLGKCYDSRTSRIWRAPGLRPGNPRT